MFSCHSGTSYKELADVLKEAEDKIIFIDNADHALMKSEVYDAIDSDLCDGDSNNYYVLIGRDTRLANLVTSPSISRNTNSPSADVDGQYIRRDGS